MTEAGTAHSQLAEQQADRLREHTKRFGAQSAIDLPLTLLQPSRTNPRKRFDEAAMAELAASIQAHGVLAPLLARPNPAYQEGNGRPPYELVAGERRWRASQQAGLSTAPVLVRDLNDLEVLEIQLQENISRADLHPMEEAEGLQAILQNPRGALMYRSPDELAARLGRSRSWLFQRLQLLQLSDKSREAFLADKISTKLAQVLARVPVPAQQDEALAHALQGFGGEVLSPSAAAEWIRKRFLLRLATAPFDQEAAYQVAGPCAQCPKRSGAKPDLFDDLAGADHCLDSACFEAKSEEAVERVLDAARAKGQTVLEPRAARELMPSPKVLPSGYHWLYQACPALTDSKRPLAEIMGEHKAVLLLDHPDAPLPIALVPTPAVIKTLKARGLLRDAAKPKPEPKPTTDAAAPGPAPSPAPATEPAWPAPVPVTRSSAAAAPQPYTAEGLVAAVETRGGQLFSRKLATAITACMQTEDDLPLVGLRIAVLERMGDASIEAWRLLFALLDWALPDSGEHGYYQDLVVRLAELQQAGDGRALGEAFLLSLVVEELSAGDTLENLQALGDSYALQLAEHYGVAIDELEEAALEEADAEVQAEQARRRMAAEGDAAAVFAKTEGAAA